MSVTFDTSILLSYYQAKAGILNASSGGTTTTTAQASALAKIPTAPWNAPAQTPAETSALVKGAMSGKSLIDESAAQLDVTGASADYKKLFALYQGLSTLSGVAEQMNGKSLSDFDKSKISSVFEKGLAELQNYAKTADLDQVRLTAGQAATSAKTTLGIARAQTSYVTDPVTSSTTEPVAAYEGDVKFNISVKRVNTTYNVPIDLSGMGSQPRTIGAVVSYINNQLQATGVETRLATQRIPGQPRTITVKGSTTPVTLPAGPDQWALKVNAGTSETITFSAPQTAPAVYVAQSTGNPDPDKNPTTNDGVTPSQLLKFQADPNGDVPPVLQGASEANWVDGRAFAETLGPEVKAVRATAVGADGSVYMLADVTDKTDGQGIKGAQDVALMRYDPAGKLVYSRTLGASDTATGLALAIGPDGKIAVAGSVTGSLNGTTDGPMNSGDTGSFATQSDSFVTLYNPDGEELWTSRRGARQADEASEITFGADGTVYVAGRSKSAMPGGGYVGDYDSYVEAYAQKLDVNGRVVTKFTQNFGTTGADKPAGLVVDGQTMYTATVENGHGVLRSFDLSSGSPVLGATRDLGDLQGGDIAGLALDNGQLVVAGSTTNSGLTGATVSRAYAGGSDAFAARVSTSLTADAADRIAFYGGSGDDKATSMSVSGGKVYIGGQTVSTDLPGQAPVGTKDGFVANIDVNDGSIDWSSRFTGKDGIAAPTSIAVSSVGASVLDRLKLPTGTLDLADSQQIVAQSSIRPNDTFTVAVGNTTKTVTISATDTLDTLAQNIRRASGFQAKVTITTVSGVRSLKIEPLNDRTLITIAAGKTNKDALSGLGIPEGVVRATEVNKAGKTVSADGKGMFYGLGLTSDLNVDDKDSLSHVMAVLASAQGIVRSAYKDLVAAAAPPTTAASAAASGPVPAYLTAQIANYQAALSRLTGGG
jgi:hypothetical protein